MRPAEALPVRLYRRALVLLPRAFRQRYGAGMADMLADEWRERRGLKCAARLASAAADLLWTAAIERLGGTGSPNEKGAHMTSRRTLGLSWLDFKLGFRMLVKYPGLTIVGGLAIAFAIWVGAATFEFVSQVVHPKLPLPEGDRIVGVRLWHTLSSSVEEQALHEFVTWREELESIENLGAFRTLERNLIIPDGPAEPIEVAEISASAFRVARVPALLGRTLVAADERAEAPRVIVIGHDVWRTRFGGDPDILGSEVRVGDAVHAVVGVMPEGFGFPIAHDAWVPLRLNPADYGGRQGPAINIFGRLAPGATLEDAQAELTLIGQRMTAAYPDTHEHLRPQVMPYAKSIMNMPMLYTLVLSTSAGLAVLLLLMLICGNVALLLFARAATRESEIVVRNALGASRGRIIGQLFVEALVLAGVAAVIGLAAANFGLEWALGAIAAEQGREMPFWFHASLSPGTVLFAGVLTVLAAAIASVVPALKVTRGLATRLRQTAAAGGRFRFGGIWTAVVVAQVAATVAFPVITYYVYRDMAQISRVEVGFPEREYLAARLEMDPEALRGKTADGSPLEFLAHYRATVEELERRLTAEPDVAGVTVAERLPRMYHPHRRIEVDDGGAAPPDPRLPAPGYRISSVSVAPDYFDVLEAPILAGRGFYSADAEPDARAIIVNESFVDRVLGGRNPIGRRVRYLYFAEWGDRRPANEAPGPWYEIVGVVRDLGMAPVNEAKVAGLYHAIGSGATPGDAYPLHLAVHVRGDLESSTHRLRTLAAAVDPTLRLAGILPVAELDDAKLEFYALWLWLAVLVTSVALLLSLAGIYAVMSFTVSQRTREIGIRVALGADARRLALAVFRRPLTQVGIGVLVGAILVTVCVYLINWNTLPAQQAALVVAYAALMMGVCLLACIVPTRRALRVQPAEVLKEET